MLEIRKLSGDNWKEQIPMRSQFEYQDVNDSVSTILEDVRVNGDSALRKLNM